LIQIAAKKLNERLFLRSKLIILFEIRQEVAFVSYVFTFFVIICEKELNFTEMPLHPQALYSSIL